MRDKLAEAINKARDEWHDDLDPAICLDTAIAYAVTSWLREYLGSDEVVDRAAEADWRQESWRAKGRDRSVAWEEAGDGVHEKYRGLARAALSSIMEQIDRR